MLNLRQFDLWAWATYTDTQKAAILLGSIPPKLDRQHEKAWVLLTFPTCTQLIYSVQSHSHLTQPSVFSVPSPLATSSFSPPSDDIHCQVFQSPFNENQMLLCDICNAGWHLVFLLPPLTTIPHGTWKCPLWLPRHLLPQTATLHLRLPSPILNLTLINIIITTKRWLAIANPRFRTIHYHLPKKKMYFQTLPSKFRPHTHMRT